MKNQTRGFETAKVGAIERYVRELMPGRTEEEIEDAIHRFKEYLLVVKDIVDRLEREGKEMILPN